MWLNHKLKLESYVVKNPSFCDEIGPLVFNLSLISFGMKEDNTLHFIFGVTYYLELQNAMYIELLM